MDSRELITFLSSSVEENIEITIERTYTKLPFDSFVRLFMYARISGVLSLEKN